MSYDTTPSLLTCNPSAMYVAFLVLRFYARRECKALDVIVFFWCKEYSSCGLCGTFKVPHKTAFLKGKSASLGEKGA